MTRRVFGILITPKLCCCLQALLDLIHLTFRRKVISTDYFVCLCVCPLHVYMSEKSLPGWSTSFCGIFIFCLYTFTQAFDTKLVTLMSMLNNQSVFATTYNNGKTILCVCCADDKDKYGNKLCIDLVDDP